MKVPEPVRLIGNLEENFYILGKKHQTAFLAYYRQAFPASRWQETWQGLKQQFARSEALKLPESYWGQWLKSYCEGLDVSPRKYLEFLGHLERTLPVGGTSVFRWDPLSQTPEHLRLVDWPRAHAQGLELIFVEVTKTQKLLLVCLPGLAFLPLSAMNSQGLTVGLHSKFHPLTHPEGNPISEAVINGLLQSTSVTELRRYLKSFQSQRLWGLHALDASGQVLVMDIVGPQVDVITADLKDAPLLVFNNLPLSKIKHADSAEPPAFSHFCRERREWCLDRLQNLSDGPALVALTRAHKLHRAPSPAVTLATTQALSLQPGHQSLEVLVGEAPLWQQGSLVRWMNLFQGSMRTHELIPTSYPKDEKHELEVRTQLSLAQLYKDQGQLTEAFHHIQMGLAMAEGELRAQTAWVWSYWQWQELKTKKDHLLLYRELHEVLRRTSSQHRPHVQLLRFLLEVELHLSPTITPEDIQGPIQHWAKLYLTKNALERTQWCRGLDVRLDIKDIVIGEVWTETRQPV